MQKGFAPILMLIGVLILAVVAGGAYYLGQRNPPQSGSPETKINTKQEITPTSKADEMASWKTYTNPSGVFTVKYPPEITIANGNNTREDVTFILKGPTQKDQTELYDGISLGFKVGFLGSKSLKEFVDAQVQEVKKNSPDPDPIKVNPAPINIAGVEGYKYVVEGLGKHIYFILPAESRQYLQIRNSTEDPTLQGFDSTVNKILATIKFLDQGDTEETGSVTFNGRKLTIKLVGEGEYCEGRVSSSQTTYSKCSTGLKCEQPLGSAADAPGVCVKE